MSDRSGLPKAQPDSKVVEMQESLVAHWARITKILQGQSVSVRHYLTGSEMGGMKAEGESGGSRHRRGGLRLLLLLLLSDFDTSTNPPPSTVSLLQKVDTECLLNSLLVIPLPVSPKRPSELP